MSHLADGQLDLFRSWQQEALQVEPCTTAGCEIRHGIRGPCFNCRLAAKRETAAPNEATAISNTTPAGKLSVYASR